MNSPIASHQLSHTLHDEAYEAFRYHLNEAYSQKNDGNIYGLSVGYPAAAEFELPLEILQHLMPIVNGREKPRAGYGWEAGSLPVREAIIDYENISHNTDYNLQNVCIVAGATYGLNRVLEHLFTDEQFDDNRNTLLVVGPTFYRMLGRAPAYANVTSVTATEKNDFQITLEEITAAITDKTKAVFLLNPGNPTYIYQNNHVLEELIRYLSERDIYLIIDESGDGYICDDSGKYEYHRMTKHIDNPYVIRIVTASKKYQLAEFRIGYVLAGKQFIGTKVNGFIKLIGDDMSNPPLAANDAWLAILQHEIMLRRGETCSKPQCDFQKKFNEATVKLSKLRTTTISELESMPHIRRIIYPDASFNLVFSFDTDKDLTDIDIFNELIDKYHVSLVPGSGFGMDPKSHYFRLTFAIREQELIAGLGAIRRFTESDFL